MSLAAGVPPRGRLERTGIAALLVFAGALQFSIAVADIFLAVALVCWAAFVLLRDDPVEVPRFWWALVVYATLTLVSAAFSPDPRTSFVDSRQVVLFLIVPMAYEFGRGARATTVLKVVITLGAISAAIGIAQYGLFNYDNLGQRPQGALGHYMTYSGLLLLVIGGAAAHLLFNGRDRAWTALVMPALVVALVLTFTRSAWVGACASVMVLLALRNVRLIPILPLLAVLVVAMAPERIAARAHSMFDMNDPTNRDRFAMLREGRTMVRAHPLTGIGPGMVLPLYQQYRDPQAVARVNPHLHNVPMQIAAERGLPALLAWIAFVATALVDLFRLHRRARFRWLTATALAGMIGMLAAGLFEYNFGDSEFLMLLLLLITLPFAAERTDLP